MKERIQALSKERGMGLSAVDAVLGFGNGTIGKWDKASPSADKLKMVADYFGVSVDYLLTGEQKEKPGISTELSYTHYLLIDRINQMSEAEAEAFLRTLDAFQAMQRTLTPRQD